MATFRDTAWADILASANDNDHTSNFVDGFESGLDGQGCVVPNGLPHAEAREFHLGWCHGHAMRESIDAVERAAIARVRRQSLH